MPSIEQRRTTIEAQLAELRSEIVTLQGARVALSREERSPGAARGGMTNGDAGSRRRRTPTAGRNRRDVAKRPTDGALAQTVVGVPDKRLAKTAAPSPSPPLRTPAERAKAAKVQVLLAENLETMLRDDKDGLSAVTISKRANASYGQVLHLLRKLESAGQVRRGGTRRTSRWRVITDEERIAERAAELEIRMAKSRS